MSKTAPDITKLPRRLLIENRSAARSQQEKTENIQPKEKKEEAKKVTSNELEQPPQLKAYIKYPRYDFF